jgi:tripartite-type tricarboxylate transporter receptor subunit TctC
MTHYDCDRHMSRTKSPWFSYARDCRNGQRLPMRVWVAALCLGCPAVQAQHTQITRPIRLIVPYVPGGLTDTLSRIVSPHIAEEFGQQVVIDNRGGGNSTIGTQLIARATADGHTIGMIDAAFLINPILLSSVPYETPRDFTPIGLIAIAPLVLVVNPNVPVKSVKELVAMAKAQPGKLVYGSAGNGSAVHLAGEQLRSAAAINILHVPYKGTGQAMSDIIGGQLNMMFMVQGTARPHVAGGRLRALAHTAPKRSRAMPEVMTFAEAGYPTVEAATINGLIGPAGLPKDFVQRVNATVVRAMNTREQQERLLDFGADVTTNTPEQFAAWIRSEMGKWAKAVKDSGARVDNN